MDAPNMQLEQIHHWSCHDATLNLSDTTLWDDVIEAASVSHSDVLVYSCFYLEFPLTPLHFHV